MKKLKRPKNKLEEILRHSLYLVFNNIIKTHSNFGFFDAQNVINLNFIDGYTNENNFLI